MRWMQARLLDTVDAGRGRAASSERGEPKLDKSMRGGLSAAPSLAVDC